MAQRKPQTLEDVLLEAYRLQHGTDPTPAQMEILKGFVMMEQGLRAAGASIAGDDPLKPRGPLQ